jgi:hypothetical protein
VRFTVSYDAIDETTGTVVKDVSSANPACSASERRLLGTYRPIKGS